MRTIQIPATTKKLPGSKASAAAAAAACSTYNIYIDWWSIYITERTELSFWPSICRVGCRWVNQFEAWTQLIAKMVWECGGNWEWGKDSHVVHLHIVINFDHSSESEITNCQSCCKMQMLSSAGMKYKCGCQASQRYSYRERLSIVHARILALYPGGG